MRVDRKFVSRVGLLVAMMVALVAGPVAAASAATQSPVNALSCFLAGGQATIPAGTEVEVRLGNVAKNRGLASDFRMMQTTTLSIDGGSATDISGFWGTPEPLTLDPYGDVWRTRVIYDTGIVLGQGESMHFQFVLAEPHLYLDDLAFANGVSGRPSLYAPAVYTYDCTVTGV
jgi:hypothetical protein